MDTVIMILFIVLLLAVEHYLPWPRILHMRELPRLAAYVMGVLALILPLSWLHLKNYFLNSDPYALEAASMLWLAVITGGLTMIIISLFDGWLNNMEMNKEGAERESALMGVINGKDDESPRR